MNDAEMWSLGFTIGKYAFYLILALLFFLNLKTFSRLFGIIIVGESEVVTVTKKFGTKNLANGKIIAANNEAGTQAYTLSPGLRFGFFPWQYSIERGDLTVIEPGYKGEVSAIDGEPIPSGRLLGKHVECNLFQDGAAFLANGGQRGPQATVVPPGKYRFNKKLFSVEVKPVLIIPANKVGIVTTYDGNALDHGDIAGEIIEGHSSFQDADSFVKNGGRRGLQQQVMMSGTYYHNSRFMEVELIDLTDIPIGYVGVVISYVGKQGVDVSGVQFTHGNIVENGCRGVWVKPLDPGRYPVNIRTTKVENVPTTNTVLNWITGYNEGHGLDDGLDSIDVRSMDGFSFKVDVSQIIHIAANDAPRIIARFGSVKNLVSQVLEPAIDNYFRNSAQSAQFLDFLREREERQKQAAKFIKDNLRNLDVEAVDTFVGDIVPPQSIMETLTARKVAEEQQETYKTQEVSQTQRIELEKAKNKADTQGQIVQAERALEMATISANAAIAKANGEAQAKVLEAEAEAKKIILTGNAEATKIKAEGDAKAGVLKNMVEAIGQDNWSSMEILRHLSENHIPLVPQIVAGQGSDNGIANILVANMLSKMTKVAQDA